MKKSFFLIIFLVASFGSLSQAPVTWGQDVHVDITVVEAVGFLGTSPGYFSNPADIASNATHHAVADRGNNRVQLFDHSWNYVSEFAYSAVRSVVMNDSHIIGYNYSGIHVFDQSGAIVDFANNDTRDYEQITSNGTHYLAFESGDYEIHVYDLALNHVDTFEEIPAETGVTFSDAYHVAANATHVVVGDYGNDQLLVYDLAGNFVANHSANNNFGLDRIGDYWVHMDYDESTVELYDTSFDLVSSWDGSHITDFNDPRNIRANGTHLFVAAERLDQVLVLEVTMVDLVVDTETSVVTETEVVTETNEVTETNDVTQVEETTVISTIEQPVTTTVEVTGDSTAEEGSFGWFFLLSLTVLGTFVARRR